MRYDLPADGGGTEKSGNVIERNVSETKDRIVNSKSQEIVMPSCYNILKADVEM